MSRILEIQGLKVRYGSTVAVDELSLSLSKGEALGLLGANGAGKTSTLRCLMGMQNPSGGKISVFDSPPGAVAVLKKTGFAPEEGVPPENVSGQEYLEFVGALRGLVGNQRKEECAALLADFDLVPHKRVREYSKGMKRRLVLAQAFLANPALLVLDEPLNGLDPLVIVKLRGRLEKFRTQGGSLLYSSHILSEVEKTCSRIVILRQGRLVLDTPVARALEQYGSVEKAFESVVGAAPQ